MSDTVHLPTPTLTTILLTVDDSDRSSGAIKVAAELAADSGAELLVLSVLPKPEVYGLMGLDARAADENRTTSMVERIAAEARAAGIRARSRAVRGGNPAEAIVAVAREINADVIIVGRRGRNDLARAMLGDVTARIIGAASCPVLVVPRAAVRPTKRILLATDGSPASERAGRTAALCAKIVRLAATVVSVVATDTDAQKQTEAARVVDRTVNFLQKRGVDATGTVARGVIADEIVRTASEVGADLIVVGSEGRSGLGRVMLGATCQAVIGKSTCPVLVTTARMPEYQPVPKAATSPSVTRSDPIPPPPPPRRTFLLVVDDTEEMAIAIDYACRRAHATDGAVMLLRVIPGSRNEDVALQSAAESLVQEQLAGVASKVQKVLGEAPKTFVRWGDPPQQVLDLLTAEPAISVLVLAASSDPRGPGPLITELVTKYAAALPVPLMIIPSQSTGRPL